MQLLPHQELALNETYDRDRVAYYLDMGLGKTFVGGEKLWELNTPYNLVICQKSQIDYWVDHFKTHYNDFTVIKYDKQLISNIPEDSILVVNYERAWRRPELLSLQNFTLMLDESSKIKSDKSNQTKFILSLRPSGVILLSGTPIGGKYEELWTQCHLLGWKISKDLFMKQFVQYEWDELNQKKVITGYKNVERLKKKLREYGAIFMKTEDVFDLPAMNENVVKIPNTKLYTEFEKHHILELPDEVLIGDTPASKKMYLRQLASAYNEHKIQYLKDMLDGTNDRVIIFYNFKKELAALRKIIDKPLSVINGDEKDLTAYEECDNSITLIQYQAGAMGLNLQKSNKIVYFSLTDKSELFEQSKKRIHRIGQDRPCFYYYLLSAGSIEWRMLEVLRDRKDYTDALFEEEEM